MGNRERREASRIDSCRYEIFPDNDDASYGHHGEKDFGKLPGAEAFEEPTQYRPDQPEGLFGGRRRDSDSVEEALDLVKGQDPDEVFCIGGAQIYRLFLPYCDKALITRIDHVYDADAFLPDLDKDPSWELWRKSEEQVFFDLTYHFCTYKRISMNV